ncbi:MAG: HAD family hydrolase [Planctomycetota bacterium]
MVDGSQGVVFVDRDGTINREVHHLSDPAQLELLPGAGQGLRRLYQAGFRLIVVTNQSPIGRGVFGEDRLRQIHDRLAAMLRDEGVEIDGWYWCPHRPDEGCECRKPAAGLLVRAIDELGGTLERCWMIGDKLSDLQAGRKAGAFGILVGTGYGREQHDLPESADCVDRFVPTLAEAAECILQWDNPVEAGSAGA